MSPAWWAVSLALAAALVYLACRGVEWRVVWATLTTARLGYIAAAMAVTSFNYFLRGLRWRILLTAEAPFGVGEVFWANMTGYLGNNLLPARAGEFLRTVLISRRSSLTKTFVLTTALAERLMDVIALVLGSSLVLLAIEPKPRWMQDASGVLAAGSVCAAVAVIVLPHTGRLLETILARIPMPAALRPRAIEFARQVLLGLKAFHNVRRLAAFTAFTVVIWLADAVALIAVGQAIGMELRLPVAMLLLAGLGLGSALPSTPGFVGIYQFVAVTVLAPFGFPKSQALAYILLAQAQGYVVVLAFGLRGLMALRRPARL